MDRNELESLKQKYLAEVNFRRGDTAGVDYKYNIMVCGGTGCRSCKSKKVQEELERIVKEKGLDADIKINGVDKSDEKFAELFGGSANTGSITYFNMS